MDSYGLVLFLHLCALLGAIGTAALLHYAEVRLRAANSAATIQSWAGLIEKGARVFPLALVVLLGSGAYLVHRRWSWSAGWVEAALIGVGVLFVVGAGVVGGRSRALKRELRGAEGAVTARLLHLAREHVGGIASWTNTGLALGIVFVMATKPALVALSWLSPPPPGSAPPSDFVSAGRVGVVSEERVGVAVVLGARNLGGAITRDLLARGVRVATVARTAADLAVLQSDGALALHADAADPEQLRVALDRAAVELGPLGLVVNAVSADRPSGDGHVFGGGSVASASMAGFEGWAVPAARHAFVFLREGARALEGRGGTLIQIAGAPARRASRDRGLIAAGMAGVRALAHASAHETRGDGIHVALLIVDGIIESPKTAQMSAGMPTDALVRQEDVVHAIRFLAEQSPRGLTHELVITAAGDRWLP